MIEFAILFTLGFLAALLLVLMFAPAIQRRIVAYTEKRLYATMPFSPAEVRAQKDMAKALYAAENARIRQELDDERKRAIELRVRHDDEEVFHRTIEENTQTLQAVVGKLETEVTGLKDHLESKQQENKALAEKLTVSEELAATRAQEITQLSGKVKQISRQLDEVKIQLASRSIEMEQEKSRALNFKTERDSMSKELIGAEAKNKDAAEKITRESRRVTLLEQKLAEKAASDADNETLLERRANEIARLKERLRAAATQVSGKGSGAMVADEAYVKSNNNGLASDRTTGDGMSDDMVSADDIEIIRQRSTALRDRLLSLQDKTEDGELRDEMAALAAQMVALTAKREGASSPIHRLLQDVAIDDGDDNLAVRAKRDLASLQS